MSLKALQPTLREKKRYLCFYVQDTVLVEDIQKQILSRVKRWIGEKNYSLARVHFMSKYFNNGIGIISCNHRQYLDVKAGMLLVNSFAVDVFYVSGTLKKAKEEIAKKVKKLQN